MLKKPNLNIKIKNKGIFMMTSRKIYNGDLEGSL